METIIVVEHEVMISCQILPLKSTEDYIIATTSTNYPLYIEILEIIFL